MTDLKLIALDAEDLAVLSAHLQDAVLRVADIAYLKREKRFAAILNRFDWNGAAAEGSKRKRQQVRRRSGLRFERVLAAQTSGFDLKAKDAVLNLLAIGFEPSTEAAGEPEGHVLLLFSGGAAIRLHVECIESELKDLGAAWRARAKPSHPGDEPPTRE